MVSVKCLFHHLHTIVSLYIYVLRSSSVLPVAHANVIVLIGGNAIMVSESKRFFFLNLFHLCDGILLAMCDVTVVATLVESTVNLCTVHLSCFKMAFASCPFPD